jgi:delta(3,5)-delta(2,4)-dienoyl-CoA isomerase
VIVLTGAGDRAFTTGLDVAAASSEGSMIGGKSDDSDSARRANVLRRHIVEFQDCISAVERCEKRKSKKIPA